MVVEKSKAVSLAIKMFEKVKDNNLVFLCLGSGKVLFDSLAVLVGDKLKEEFNINTYVYGGSKNNITTKNLKEYVTMIKKYHPMHKIVVIDSALGVAENVGLVKIFECGTIPRSAIDDSCDIVGDYSIIGIVGEKNQMIKNLLLTDKVFISNMASTIASGINEFFKIKTVLKAII